MKVRFALTKRISEMSGFEGGEGELREGTTIAGALEEVTGRFVGAESRSLFREGQLHPAVLVVVNGETCLPDDRVAPLSGGETIDLFLPVAGG